MTTSLSRRERKMDFVYSKRLLRGILLGLVFIAASFLAPSIDGAARAENGAGVTEIPIESEGPVDEENNPLFFDGAGLIDRMNDKEVVINDMLFKLSASVAFHTMEFRNVSKNWFKAGEYVGYKLNPTGEINSMWLLKKEAF